MKAEIYLLQVLLLTVSGWVNRHQQRVIYIFCDTLEVRTEDGMMVGSVQWSGNSLGTSLPPGKELVAARGASSALVDKFGSRPFLRSSSLGIRYVSPISNQAVRVRLLREYGTQIIMLKRGLHSIYLGCR